MAQNLDSSLPNGAVFNSQKVQGYHYPQQGPGATTPPQGLYPPKVRALVKNIVDPYHFSEALDVMLTFKTSKNQGVD